MSRTISCSSDPIRCPWRPAVATYTMHIWCGPTMLMPLMLIVHVEKQKINDIASHIHTQSITQTITKRSQQVFFGGFHSQQQRGRFIARIPSIVHQVSLAHDCFYLSYKPIRGRDKHVDIRRQRIPCQVTVIGALRNNTLNRVPSKEEKISKSKYSVIVSFCVFFRFSNVVRYAMLARKQRDSLAKHLWNGRSWLVEAVGRRFHFVAATSPTENVACATDRSGFLGFENKLYWEIIFIVKIK